MTSVSLALSSFRRGWSSDDSGVNFRFLGGLGEGFIGRGSAVGMSVKVSTMSDIVACESLDGESGIG